MKDFYVLAILLFITALNPTEFFILSVIRTVVYVSYISYSSSDRFRIFHTVNFLFRRDILEGSLGNLIVVFSFGFLIVLFKYSHALFS